MIAIIILCALVFYMSAWLHGTILWAAVAVTSIMLGFALDRPAIKDLGLGRRSTQLRKLLYWSDLTWKTGGFVVCTLIAWIWPGHDDATIRLMLFALSLSAAAGICRNRGLFNAGNRPSRA